MAQDQIDRSKHPGRRPSDRNTSPRPESLRDSVRPAPIRPSEGVASSIPQDDTDDLLGNIDDLTGPATAPSAITPKKQDDDKHDVYDEPGNEPNPAPKSHTPEELEDAEEEADDDQSSDADEEESQNHNRRGAAPGRQPKKRIMLSVGKRRAMTIALVFGMIFGGGGGTFFILKGPLELVQLGGLFDGLDWRTDHSVKSRLRQFAMQNPLRCRLGSCDTIGETRVTFTGSRRFHNIRSQMEDAGIGIERRAIDDRPIALTIDSARNPEFRNPASVEAKQAAIAEFFGVDTSRVQITSRLEGRFRINLDRLGIGAIRSIMFTAIRPFVKGRIATALSKRVFSNFLGLPTLYQPSRRLAAEVENRYNSRVGRSQQERERRRTMANASTESTPSRYRAYIDSVRSAISPNVAQNVNRALFVADALCAIRAVAVAIPFVNYAAIVIPSVLAAIDKEAWKGAIQAGETSLGQAGSVVESLVDEDGVSVWAAKSLNELVYQDGGRGIDIDNELKQAFTSFTTGNAVLDWLGDNGISELACSPGGQLVLTLVDVTVTVVTFGSWSAAKAAALGGSTAASIAAIGFLQNYAIDQLSENPVEEFAGPQGGNLMAYGARAGANINGIRMGGIALGGTETKAQLEKYEAEQKEEFQKKNWASRMFDPAEKRSFLASAVRSSNTSPSKTMSNLASGFMNSTKLLSSIFSVFTSKVSAQANEPYEWDFPIYGVPSQILDDPAYDNPYENAELAGEIFDGDQGQQYIDKARDCFGVDIRRVAVDGGRELWSVLPDEEVNPNEDSYTEADCGNVGDDENWARVLVFVFDTSLVTIVDCYQGNQEACEIMIYGLPEEEDPGGPVPTNPGDCPNTQMTITEGEVANEIARRIVTVEGTEVHGCIAEQFGRMVAAARNDGVDISGGGGYRSLQEQINLRRANCGTSDFAIYEMDSGSCSPPTARPGRSQHERGLAIDFRNCSTRGTACYQWLNSHAAEFGFINFEEEAWHWSTSGS